MISTWTDYAGRTAGNWRLDSLLGVRDDTAYYMATEERTGTTALVHLIQAETDKGEAVRDSWELARTIDHPQVLRVFDSGDAWIEGSHLNYAVTEIPDDDVSEMQSRGELTKSQARRIAEQAGQALDYLHTNNLIHGGVRPATIFLIGDRVKLGIDSLTAATDGGRAQDLKQLWEIFPVEEPAPEPELDPELDMPSHAPYIPSATSHLTTSEPPARKRLPWAVIGVAAGAALALLGYRSMHSTATTPPAEAAPIAASRPAPVASRPAAKPLVVDPPAPKPSPIQTRSRRTDVEGGSWAVIAATYSSYPSADGRAKKITKETRRVKAHVYPEEGKGNLYYVILGSGLSQKDAEKLKRTALQAGAPRDTYVSKLNDR